MLNIIFHPDIENEVKASYEWYQNQAEGLGEDFLTELETAYQAIIELQGHSITYRIVVGPQQGRKVFTLQKIAFVGIYSTQLVISSRRSVNLATQT